MIDPRTGLPMATQAPPIKQQPIDFITSNPATAAYTAGVNASQDQYLKDLAAQRGIVNNAVDLASAPSKLRKINAEASSEETAADVANRTADSNVATAANRASLTGTQAQVAAAVAPSDISKAGSAATSAAAEADVATQTVPTKVASAKAGLRQQQATALATEMGNFYKTLDLLNAGDFAGAQEVASRTGQTIPPEVIQSADVRGAITRAAKRAQELYPDRPADQQTFIQGFLKDMATRKAQGQPASDPAAPYNVPGAPEPPSGDDTKKHNYELLPGNGPDANGNMVAGMWQHDKLTGERTFHPGESATTRGGAGRDSVFAQRLKVGSQLFGEGSQAAADYANGRRQLTPPEAMKFGLSQAETELRNDPTISTNFKAPSDRIDWKNKRAQEIATTITAGQGAPAPTTTAPTAAPVAATAGAPPGNGTKEAPYQATTQAHIDWFKQNARPGDIIIVNGAPYTK